MLPLSAITLTRTRLRAENAVSVAEKNARGLGVSGRIDFLKSDLFSSLEHGGFAKKFDLIVTNPPYIKASALSGLEREIKDHEPLLALDGGADGLDFYRRIAADAKAYMSERGCLMSEIGADQAQDTALIFSQAGFEKISIQKDLSGRERIILAF